MFGKEWELCVPVLKECLESFLWNMSFPLNYANGQIFLVIKKHSTKSSCLSDFFVFLKIPAANIS